MLNEKGFSLIEVIISIAILGIVGVGILAGLGTSSKALITADERETAKNIAEMQLEYVKGQPYAATYTPAEIGSTYPGYSADIATSAIESRDGDIQQITATIKHGNKTILAVAGYKVRP